MLISLLSAIKELANVILIALMSYFVFGILGV